MKTNFKWLILLSVLGFGLEILSIMMLFMHEFTWAVLLLGASVSLSFVIMWLIKRMVSQKFKSKKTMLLG